MCAIFGSFKKKQIPILANLNSHRGPLGFSISCIDTHDPQYKPYYVHRRTTPWHWEPMKHPGKLHGEPTRKQGRYYWLCHLQAPTTGQLDLARVHPARISTVSTPGAGTEYLWHNGILRNFTGAPAENVWDTAVLLEKLHRARVQSLMFKNNIPEGKPVADVLSEARGSFACVHHNSEGLRIFRNELAMLWIDEEMTISSSRFDGKNAIPLQPHTIYDFQLRERKLRTIGVFKEDKPVYYGLDK